MEHILLRLPRVKSSTGKSKSTIYLEIQRGLLPPPVEIGPRARGWPAREIDAINAARIAGKSEREICALVAELVAARAKAL